MELARHPYVTAGVALAAASMIAVTPVAPPPLALQERAVQLSGAVEDGLANLAGEAGQVVSAITGAGGSSGLIGALLNPSTALTDIGNLPNVGDPSNLGALLDPVSGLAGLDSGIQTAPINASMALEAASNNGAATLLIDLAGSLYHLAQVLVQNGFPGLATLATFFELVLELVAFVLGGPGVAVPGASASTMLADPAIGLSSLGALPDPSIGLSGLDPTASVVSDLMLSPTTAVADLGTMLNPGDLSTLLNPADFATLFDPADIPTMLLSLIP